jgi:hypothetical protein
MSLAGNLNQPHGFGLELRRVEPACLLAQLLRPLSRNLIA